jgi:hypothetical protein
MPRANRHYIPGYVWHITHRCHKREFLLKFSRDRRRWLAWLCEAKTKHIMSLLRTNLIRCWLSILLILLTTGVLKAAEFPIIDAHSQADQHISFEEILSLMKEAGVSRTILSLRGQRQPEELISFAARHPDRITPAVRTKGSAYLKGPKQFEQFLNTQMQMAQFGAIAEGQAAPGGDPTG